MGRLTIKECHQRARDCVDAAHAANPAERERLIRQTDDWMILASAVQMERPLKLDAQGLFPVAACGDAAAIFVKKQHEDYGRMIKEADIR